MSFAKWRRCQAKKGPEERESTPGAALISQGPSRKSSTRLYDQLPSKTTNWQIRAGYSLNWLFKISELVPRPCRQRRRIWLMLGRSCLA
ncbi:Dimethylglycine oxidase [Fusarium oxysporum f. sp. albedinis]|nr:Dimethylglycine oxidase [Fusarium oxysporum f. sp. albedinis]